MPSVWFCVLRAVDRPSYLDPNMIVEELVGVIVCRGCGLRWWRWIFLCFGRGRGFLPQLFEGGICRFSSRSWI